MWWHMVTHGRGSEGETGEWSGQPVLLTLPRNMVYPALLPLMRTPRLPVVDWTDAPADLNGLVRFGERRNLFSASVPSHFNWPLLHIPSVSVTLVIQHAMRMRCIFVSSVACLVLKYFSILSHKRHDFRKEILNIKLYFHFLYNFCLKHFAF